MRLPDIEMSVETLQMLTGSDVLDLLEELQLITVIYIEDMIYIKQKEEDYE